MFGLGFRLKVKFWQLAIRASVFILRVSVLIFCGSRWLKKAIEAQAAKSVGLIGGGAMLVARDGEIMSSYLQTIDDKTAFGPN